MGSAGLGSAGFGSAGAGVLGAGVVSAGAGVVGVPASGSVAPVLGSDSGASGAVVSGAVVSAAGTSGWDWPVGVGVVSARAGVAPRTVGAETAATKTAAAIERRMLKVPPGTVQAHETSTAEHSPSGARAIVSKPYVPSKRFI